MYMFKTFFCNRDSFGSLVVPVNLFFQSKFYVCFWFIYFILLCMKLCLHVCMCTSVSLVATEIRRGCRNPGSRGQIFVSHYVGMANQNLVFCVISFYKWINFSSPKNKVLILTTKIHGLQYTKFILKTKIRK